MSEERTAAVLLELRRIGVDFGSLSERLVGTGLRASELLAWLRAIPDHAGAEELFRRLDEQAHTVRPPVEYRWRKEPPPSPTLRRRERWWPTQALLDAGTDLLLEEWDPFGLRLAGTDREAIAMFAFHFFGPLLSPNGMIDPITHTTEMIASAERDHLALRPSPEPHRRYLARRLRQLVEANPVPSPQYHPSQTVEMVAVADDAGPPPLDPEGVCASCHSFGTVARVTTMSAPPRNARYCSGCWASVRAEHGMGRHRRKPPETAAERVAFHDSHHQPPRATISRSWLDTLDLISMMLEHTPTNDRDATGYADHLAMAASEIMNREDTMDGPMPPDVEAFVHRYARPDA